MSDSSPPDRGPRYGGFWIRLGAFFVDVIVLLPFIGLYLWGPRPPRGIFQIEPILLLAITTSYDVCSVRYWGGTPGKLLLGLRVVRADLEPAGWREAVLRESVNAALGLAGDVLFLLAVRQVSEAAFAGGSRTALMKEIHSLEGLPGRVIDRLGDAWILSEFLVLLTNRKRRALHDFLAGTVVIHRRAASNSGDTRTPEPANP